MTFGLRLQPREYLSTPGTPFCKKPTSKSMAVSQTAREVWKGLVGSSESVLSCWWQPHQGKAALGRTTHTLRTGAVGSSRVLMFQPRLFMAIGYLFALTLTSPLLLREMCLLPCLLPEVSYRTTVSLLSIQFFG